MRSEEPSRAAESPEPDVDPKALEIALRYFPDSGIPGYHELREQMARAITVLLRERVAEVGRLKKRLAQWDSEDAHESMTCYQNEKRAKSAEAALAKKDEALRRIVDRGTRLNAYVPALPHEIANAYNDVDRIAKESLDG